MTPQFFHTPSDLRAWLEANHALSQELWLRLRKTTVPGPGVTYSEALDLALCFGWIDGVRHAVDGKSFAVRLTPRKPKSTWSKVNLRHYQRLERTGSVTAAGREAFQRRESSRTGRYSFESAPREAAAGSQEDLSGQSRSLGLFHDATAVLPAHGHILGAQRAEGGDS